jgi:hypothetical protein
MEFFFFLNWNALALTVLNGKVFHPELVGSVLHTCSTVSGKVA